MKRAYSKFGLLVCLCLSVIGIAVEPAAQNFDDPRGIACGTDASPPEITREIRHAASLAANLIALAQIRSEFSSMFGVNLFDSPIFRDPRSFPRTISLRELQSVETSLQDWIARYEAIGQGLNRECREIVGFSSTNYPILTSTLVKVTNIQPISPLAQLYLYQSITRSMIVLYATGIDDDVDFYDALTSELITQTQVSAQSVGNSPTVEIALARASSIFLPLFMVLSLSGDEELTLSVLNPQIWESLACGESVTVPGFDLELDGSLSVRSGSDISYPYRKLASELWTFSSTLNNIIMLLFSPIYGQSYYDLAIDGCTTELRQRAASLYFSLNQPLAFNSVELERMVMNGESDELKWAAASLLTPLLANDITVTEADLQMIARRSTSAMMRSAAGNALGIRWMDQIESGQLNPREEFVYPPNGGINLQSGSLTQYALAHSGVHTELAQAAILPLFAAFFPSAQVSPDDPALNGE